MKNVELNRGNLLDNEGNLLQAGYSFELIKEYDRKIIKKHKSRIKEWDYYAVLNDEGGICFTISDCSIFSLISVSLLNFKNKTFITKSFLKWFTFGKTNLPSTSKIGDVVFKNSKVSMSFRNDGKQRIINCDISDFHNGKNLSARVILHETSNKSMVIATPFNKAKHFYYNQKINNLLCNGYYKLGAEEHLLQDAMGVLDWGRGIWTYKNTWYWASLSTKSHTGYKGFNLGYGFGDTSKASENMVFYHNEAFKLDDVEFIFNKDGNKINFMSPIKVQSKDKSIDLVFTPILDRKDCTNAIIIKSDQHQLFGHFSGEIKVNGNSIKFNNCIGFLEKVANRW